MKLFSVVIATYGHVVLVKGHKVLPDEGVSNTETGRRNAVNVYNLKKVLHLVGVIKMCLIIRECTEWNTSK